MKRKNLLVLLLISVMVLLASCGPKLTDDEQYVLDCINSYQNEMGVSVNDLYDGVTVINAVIDDENVRYAVIPYGGTSGSGSVHVACPVFVNGEYALDADNYDDSDLNNLVIIRNINSTFASAAGWDVVDIDEAVILEQLK